MRYYSSSSDFYYDTTASTLNYYITVNGETIYNGKAVKSPSKDVISIDVGKRVRDYIRINMPDFRNYDGVVVPHPEAMLVFNLYDAQSGGILEQYNVRIDDTKEWRGEEGCLSEPINTHADPRQKIFYGHSSSGETSVDIESVVPNPKIIFDDEFYFDWESGVTTICYTANTDFTLYSYDGGWFTVTQSKADEYTGCLTFTYTENGGRSSRDGVLCMQAIGGYVECFPVLQGVYAGGYGSQYLTFVVLSGGTIHWVDEADCIYYLEYSFDEGETWTESFLSACTINVNPGDRVMFRASNWLCTTKARFSDSTAYFNLEGNIQSLFYPSSFRHKPIPKRLYRCFENTRVVSAENLVLPAGTSKQCYMKMFESCTSLITPPVLPAVTLSEECYSNMFNACTSLTMAPELPATKMERSCYEYMFGACNIKTPPALQSTELADRCYYNMFIACDLEVAPELPATELKSSCYEGMLAGCDFATAPELPATKMEYACYRNMFGACKNLVTPPELPSTELAIRCYESMFAGSGLEVTPELPATELKERCYHTMFSGCRALTQANELPATTLATRCYAYMFRNCSSLETAPVMYPTVVAEGSCESMFSGCESLTTAPTLPATKMEAECYDYMFDGCVSLVTPPTLPSTNLALRCYSYMFRGCTSLATTPLLPATTLAVGCYRYMFDGCVSLTAAGPLPASTLVSECYLYMFNGCSSLSYVKCTATSKELDSTYRWLRGVHRTGTFVKASSASFWPSSESGIPTYWTVQNAS